MSEPVHLFLAAGLEFGAVLAVLVTAYGCAVLLKNARRFPGQLNHVPVALALLLPLLLVSWFAYDGNLWAVLPGSGVPTDPAHWWVMPIARHGDEVVTVNLLRAAVIIAGLFILTTVLVEVGSKLYARRHESGLLSIHKALIKWPIVIIGCLVALKINLGAILVGTSVAVVGIGLVLKETLDNLFTGMSLEMEGTVRRGDWIRHGEDVGVVYEKTWRATKLRTLNDVSITIPNRLLGIDKVHNFNLPTRPHARVLTVGTSYDDPPVKVKEILRTVLIRQPKVLASPQPGVRTLSYDDSSITYEMKFWVLDYKLHRSIEERIMTHIWYAFRFYGIQIPFPIRTVHLKERDQLEAEAQAIEEDVDARLDFLRNHVALGGLPWKDLDFLARNASRRHYDRDEQVIRRGEIGDALYIVQEGWCEAVLPDGKRPRLESGSYFGEMGLLSTGPRTVDVVAGEEGALVLRVDKHCMDVLFEAHPDLRAQFVKVGTERRQELPQEQRPTVEREESALARLLRVAGEVLRPW